MLRGENIVCGTSTTGTGTLALAATPVAPGGIDFDVLARATGIGFGNAAAVLASYTIIEYTDTTFATVKSTEKGIGTLTLGGSAGIANCTLARTTPQVTATSLNSQPATYNTNAPTAVSIGTAANVLVFIGASAADIPAYTPYFENALGDNLGMPPANVLSSAGSSGDTLTSGNDHYWYFDWRCPMLVKRLSARVATAYATGSPVSNAYGRVYAIGTNGRPGKLLYDFGLMGSANVSMNSIGNISSGAAGNGYFLAPGTYIINLIAILSGATTLPRWHVSTGNFASSGAAGIFGTASMYPNSHAKATGGNGATPADPANTTGYAVDSSNGSVLFTMAPS